MSRLLLFALPLLLLLPACDGSSEGPPADLPQKAAPEPYRPAVPETFGTAVMVLLDTSGSMKNAAPGDKVTKSAVAREAIGTVLDVTSDYVAKNPDRVVKVGLIYFSGEAYRVLEIGKYEKEAVAKALTRIPAPGGETAIGEAMKAAREELYRSGCLSKHIVVITDGQNTAGEEPQLVAEEIHRRSDGQVRMHFVAFDTDPKKFSFLKRVEGNVLSAKNAAGLSATLKELYEDKILAEEMPE